MFWLIFFLGAAIFCLIMAIWATDYGGGKAICLIAAFLCIFSAGFEAGSVRIHHIQVGQEYQVLSIIAEVPTQRSDSVSQLQTYLVLEKDGVIKFCPTHTDKLPDIIKTGDTVIKLKNEKFIVPQK